MTLNSVTAIRCVCVCVCVWCVCVCVRWLLDRLIVTWAWVNTHTHTHTHTLTHGVRNLMLANPHKRWCNCCHKFVLCVCVCVCVCVCLFVAEKVFLVLGYTAHRKYTDNTVQSEILLSVSRITKKLQNQFPWNCVEWGMTWRRIHSLFEWIQDSIQYH